MSAKGRKEIISCYRNEMGKLLSQMFSAKGSVEGRKEKERKNFNTNVECERKE